MNNNASLTIDDCWNRIGVWSAKNRSCEKLNDCVHCVNCNVFQQAGLHLLTRSTEFTEPDTIIQNHKQRINTLIDRSYTYFRIQKEWFAIPTDHVITVINPLLIRKIPHVSQDLISGISYYHGDAILVVNIESHILAKKSDDKRNKNKTYERFLLLQTALGKLAIKVSEVWGTQRNAPELLTPATTLGNKGKKSIIHYRLPHHDNHASLIDMEAFIELIEQQL